MKAVSLPAPYAGIDKLTPLADVQSPFAESIVNFNVAQTGVVLRNGDSLFDSLAPANMVSADKLFPYGNTRLFLTITENTGFQRTDVYDAESGVLQYSTAASGATTWFSSTFGGCLYLFPMILYFPGIYFNGSAWGAITYSGSSLAPVGGASYNRRHYLIQKSEAAYWYSGVAAITGACTKVDLSYEISEKGDLISIIPFTLADTVQADKYLAFHFSTGEVLFYTGSYPDSPNWRQVGTGFIGKPINFNAYVPYQGDALILCDSGIVSIRDLFLKGSESAKQFSISSRIQTEWAAEVATLRSTYATPVGAVVNAPVNGVYDDTNSRLIFQINGKAFIYYTQLQSWVRHSNARRYVRYQNKTLSMTHDATTVRIFQKEGATGFMDIDANGDAQSFDYEIISAPLVGGRSAIQKIEGIDAIIKSDLYTETNYSFRGDLGATVTDAQAVPNMGTSLAKAHANVGIEASYAQYKISGTTVAGKTVGYQLYGVNVWADQGGSPR